MFFFAGTTGTTGTTAKQEMMRATKKKKKKILCKIGTTGTNPQGRCVAGYMMGIFFPFLRKQGQ